MALNFWHSCGSFPEDQQLQRSPNRLHQTLYKRIRALLRSDGPAFAFEATKADRRFPELVARLGELSAVMTKNGCSASPYEKSFPGVEVPKDDTVMPELQPYRDLNPEPEVLSFPDALPVNSQCVIRVTLWPVYGRLWDQQGLLFLHRENTDADRYVKIFNAYKNSELDRQIGDRRSANALEPPAVCLQPVTSVRLRWTPASRPSPSV